MKQANHTANFTTEADRSSCPVFTMEEHDEAYHIWQRMGVKDSVLVHIDAHMDFAWYPDNNPSELLESNSLEELDALLGATRIWSPSPDPKATAPHIGDYIYPAIKDRMVREFIWVTPDDFFASKKNISLLMKSIKDNLKDIPHEKIHIILQDNIIRARFKGCNITVCALDSLPSIYEPVLLDIDVDFFAADLACAENTAILHLKKRLPWIWPEELL